MNANIKLNTPNSISFAIIGCLADLCVFMFCVLLLAKTLNLPIEILAITMLAASAAVLIKCTILLRWPAQLKKYDIIPEPARTIEQITAMLYVCENQPYIIDNFSKEMHMIADTFSNEKIPKKTLEIIVSMYRDLMNGHFQNVPYYIKELTTQNPNKESIWTTK